MATLNFPTSPSLNDTYSFNGKTWVWNGLGWQLQSQGAINGIVIGNSTPAAGTFTTLSATGNVTGANLVTTGSIEAASVSASGNVTGGNLNAAGLSLSSNVVSAINSISAITTTANISGGNVLTGGLISATGAITGANITGANLLTAGLISAGGNITGGNIITAAAVSAASVSASGNITAGNVIVGNLVFSTDTISSQDGTITIDPAAVGVTGLVIIQGNLQVNGNTTTINSNVVSTNDLTYNLANNAVNSAAANGGGIEVGPIGSPYITWLYNSTAGGWETAQGISATGNITGGNINGTLNGSGANVSSISANNISTGTLNQARLANAAVTLGSTALTLGATVTTVAGLASVTSTSFVGALTGAATTAGTVTTAAQGNITSVGTLTGLTINNATTAITNGATAGTGNIGASGAGFNTIFAKATSAQYADLAEKYSADADYAPGTVLVFGGDQEVTLSNTASDHRIAGVVSINPAHLMNSELDCQYPVAIALTGRTPTRVTGLIHKGDLMVSAGNGAAMACTTPVVGTVIGKALENFDGESGMIEVVVGVR